jgi:hypothetical protein
MADPPKRSRDSVDEIFGDPLPPPKSMDDSDSSRPDDDERERWLRENVPPHHQ